MLEISTSTVNTLLGYVGSLFTDVTPFIVVAAGIPLAFYVIRQVIALVPKARGRRQ